MMRTGRLPPTVWNALNPAVLVPIRRAASTASSAPAMPLSELAREARQFGEVYAKAADQPAHFWTDAATTSGLRWTEPPTYDTALERLPEAPFYR